MYLAVVRLALQEALQYRAESAIWFLFDVLPPIMMAFLWLAAYEGQASVAGYDLPEMLLYTLGVMVLRNVITAHVEWDIDGSIRQGTLSTYLVRPFNPWAYWFATGLAARVMRAILVTPVLVVCLVWLAPHLDLPSLDATRVPYLVLSLASAFLLSFLMKLGIGFLGFWLTDIGGLATLYEVAAYVFGGVLVPLELLPLWLQSVAAFLPFRYIYHVPLSLLLGRLEEAEIGMALIIQVGWVLALALLAGALWRRGLRRYEAVGG